MERKLLILDDDDVIRYMYQKAFEKKNYQVFDASTAENALDILERENIRVMILDLNLPGMSGVALCRHIRKSDPISIIYAVTGFTSVFEFTTCRQAGFDDYFKKPVDIDVLSKVVEDAFEKIERWTKR